MNKIVMIIIIALLSASIATSKYDEYEAVNRYKSDFEYYFHVKADSIDIRLVDEISADYKDAVGYCYKATNSIEVLRSYWEEMPPIKQQMLIFHELGHCLLGKVHTDVVLSDGCSGSIMMYHMDFADCYYKHFDELIAEFSKK